MNGQHAEPGPLRFEPFLRPMVWGGRTLAERLGKPLPTPEPYGESWDVSDHTLHRSVVAAGPHAGTSLRSLMERQRAALQRVAIAGAEALAARAHLPLARVPMLRWYACCHRCVGITRENLLTEPERPAHDRVQKTHLERRWDEAAGLPLDVVAYTAPQE